MHLEYLKEHRKGRYTNLLSEGTLNQRFYEIDVEAKQMVEGIITHLAAERGIDENSKARDMLRWAAVMNNIKASSEEIVLREVVYVWDQLSMNCGIETSFRKRTAEITRRRWRSYSDTWQGITRTWRKASPMSRRRSSKSSTIVGARIWVLAKQLYSNMLSNSGCRLQ